MTDTDSSAGNDWRYFDPTESVRYRSGDDPSALASTVANRYVGDNPPTPFTFRVSNEVGSARTADGHYRFDLDAWFPEAEVGQYVYAWATYWADERERRRLQVRSPVPTRVCVDGEVVHESFALSPSADPPVEEFAVTVEAGRNDLLLRFEKTTADFAATFGPFLWRWLPMHVRTPSAERAGREGWLFSEPLSDPLEPHPTDGTPEADTGVEWVPTRGWSDDAAGRFDRLYDRDEGETAVAWTRLRSQSARQTAVTLSGESPGEVAVLVDGNRVLEARGAFETSVEAGSKPHDVLVVATASEAGWGFDLDVEGLDAPVALEPPAPVHGLDDPWLHLGPYRGPSTVPVEDLPTLVGPFEVATGRAYWRPNVPGAHVRPFLEAGRYGNWRYQTAVVLDGLLSVADAFDRPALSRYARGHLEQAASFYEYARWDGARFGSPGVNQQVPEMDMLDYCGAPAAALVRALADGSVEGAETAVADAEAFVLEGHERLPDGTFVRPDGSVWVDDLYMSVPFLCRQHGRTGDDELLDEAVRQLDRFRERLFLADVNLLSHVYAVEFEERTDVPWGRGNGWAALALTEALAALPRSHEGYERTREFFRDLCAGVLACQDRAGRWHQVLTDPDSYPEASCSAMFVTALARGVRGGWLDGVDGAARAADAGWRALGADFVDAAGNVHGVCKGSNYSFSASYYADELGWERNDPHGVGVVLLAATAVERLRRNGRRGTGEQNT